MCVRALELLCVTHCAPDSRGGALDICTPAKVPRDIFSNFQLHCNIGIDTNLYIYRCHFFVILKKLWAKAWAFILLLFAKIKFYTILFRLLLLCIRLIRLTDVIMALVVSENNNVFENVYFHDFLVVTK